MSDTNDVHRGARTIVSCSSRGISKNAFKHKGFFLVLAYELEVAGSFLRGKGFNDPAKALQYLAHFSGKENGFQSSIKK